jgi:hypothetical protein
MLPNCGEGNGVSLARRTSQNTARIARTVGNLAISRAFSRTVSLLVIDRNRMGTDRPRKYRPLENIAFCRRFCYIKETAVDTGDVLRDSPLRGKYPQWKMHQSAAYDILGTNAPLARRR